MNKYGLCEKFYVKNSKKAFTLIELVVVIAILAILAAIAIPAVIGIISSAQSSKGDEEAQTLKSECNNFYASIMAGQINKSNFTAPAGSSIVVPNVGDSYTQRMICAKTATVADVIEYFHLDKNITDRKRYVTVSTDKYQKGDIIHTEDTTLPSTLPLTDSVPLSNICIFL